MKLEENMYVRTKLGMIAKIIDKRDVSGSLHREEIVFILDNGNRLALHSQKVVKASHNIIELIELGDYVNGYPITSINSSKGIVYEIEIKIPNNKNGVWIERIRNETDIKSIVTKEQFESMSYKVGD